MQGLKFAAHHQEVSLHYKRQDNWSIFSVHVDLRISLPLYKVLCMAQLRNSSISSPGTIAIEHELA